MSENLITQQNQQFEDEITLKEIYFFLIKSIFINRNA